MPATPPRTDHDRSRNPPHTFILPEPGYHINEEVSFGGFFSLYHTPGLSVTLVGQIVPVVFPALFLRESSADTETDHGCPACRQGHPRNTPVLQPRPMAGRGQQ